MDFSGSVQCDGYSAYRAFVRDHQGPAALAGCWAHVYRKFHESLETTPRIAGWILRRLQYLHHRGFCLRVSKAGPALRQAVRARQSRPIVERLERMLLRIKTSGKRFPQSALCTALDYALCQWTTLQVFLNDGWVEVEQ